MLIKECPLVPNQIKFNLEVWPHEWLTYIHEWDLVYITFQLSLRIDAQNSFIFCWQIGNNILHTLLVKHYNDYLDRHRSRYWLRVNLIWRLYLPKASKTQPTVPSPPQTIMRTFGTSRNIWRPWVGPPSPKL